MKSSSSRPPSSDSIKSPSSSIPSPIDGTERWIRRKYDWTAKKATYQNMPYGFHPPIDDKDSYVTLATFADEMLEEIDVENKMTAYEDADIVLFGTEWTFNQTKVDIVTVTNSDVTIQVALSGPNWKHAFLNGKTFLKQIVDTTDDSKM
jgi:hypothetical protein